VAVFAAGNSVALMQGSVFAAAGSSIATVEASSASAINLAGGNTICAGTYSGSCSATSGGLAVQIDHIANLLQVSGSLFGYSAAAETVVGGGLIEEQSNADLGVGLISSNPSMNWTTGSAGIQAEQNSSFRLSGGVNITGTVQLGQGSNGFFNLNNGGADFVSVGVTCPFNHYPVSHVTTPQNVTGGGVTFTSSGTVPTVSGVCMTF
jgi:hypothetical protein